MSHAVGESSSQAFKNCGRNSQLSDNCEIAIESRLVVTKQMMSLYL
jgi:hypothetical protein